MRKLLTLIVPLIVVVLAIVQFSQSMLPGKETWPRHHRAAPEFFGI
jgi:hypothetical protein